MSLPICPMSWLLEAVSLGMGCGSDHIMSIQPQQPWINGYVYHHLTKKCGVRILAILIPSGNLTWLLKKCHV